MNLFTSAFARSACLVALAASLSLAPVEAGGAGASPAQVKVPLKQTWSGGNLPLDLQVAAPPGLYVADQAGWERLWRAWRGGEALPKIDFDRELILVCTTVSPNSCGVNPTLDEQGDLKVGPASTLIASDAKTFNYQIGLIDRAGVRSIAGRPIPAGDGAKGAGPDGNIVARLKGATQELLDAIAPGDRAVWQRHLAEGSIYADEEGRVLTKDELLKELSPLPAGYVGSIKMGEPKVLIQENVVVLSHLDREDLELYGQKIVTYFHSTDTWAKQKDGNWRRVATQVMAIPNERKPAKVEPNMLDSYVGQYQIAAEVFYTITREDDRLYGQHTGRAREELLPLCGDIFYKKGVWRGEKVFERDTKGKIVKMLDRRENNDLVWNKIK